MAADVLVTLEASLSRLDRQMRRIDRKNFLMAELG